MSNYEPHLLSLMAFNAGCDARLRGDPPNAPPTLYGLNNLSGEWKRGWDDVHNHWGEDSTRAVRPLPAIRHEKVG